MNPEQYKYEQIYKDNVIPGYGSSCHGEPFIDNLKQFSSLIDVGCGDNSLVKRLRELNPDGFYQGIDFACEDADFIADIIDLPKALYRNYNDGSSVRMPIDPKQFHMLTAFDVLEHLRIGQIHAALENMRRISFSFLFTISFTKSLHQVDGQPLHMTVKPESWWTDVLESYAKELTTEKAGIYHGIWKD